MPSVAQTKTDPKNLRTLCVAYSNCDKRYPHERVRLHLVRRLRIIKRESRAGRWSFLVKK